MEPLLSSSPTTAKSKPALLTLEPENASSYTHKPTAEAAFARVMEWGMLRYRDEVGFASNVSENSIARMCFLDFDSLSDVCWPFSTDLKPLFQAAVEEIDNEAQRIKFLGKHLMAVVKIPDMMEQLSQMIVEELQQGAVPEIHWKSASLNEKVKLLLDFRLHKDVVHITRPDDYEQHPEKYDFEVHLMTLHRNESNLIDNTNLYISYDTSFQEFLTVLRDATQLSVIRLDPIPPQPKKGQSSLSIAQLLLPVNCAAKDRYSFTINSLEEDLHGEKRNPFRYQQESSKLDLGQLPVQENEPMSRSDFRNTAASAMGPTGLSSDYDKLIPENNDGSCRNPSHTSSYGSSTTSTGYTLFHGPWSYCIALGEGQKGPWNNIYDKDGFLKMKSALKLRSENVKTPSKVFIQHFQDKKAHESSVADGKAAHNVSTGTEEHCMETFHEWGEFEEELAASKPYGEYLRNKAELSYNDGNDGNDGLVFKTDIFSEQRLG